MKNMINKIIILVVTTIVVVGLLFIPRSLAVESGASKIISAGEDFEDQGKYSNAPTDEKKMKQSFGNMFWVVYAIGVGTDMFVGVAMGIRYMMGTVEEQAEIKETLIPFLVGSIVIFGSIGIWKAFVESLKIIA